MTLSLTIPVEHVDRIRDSLHGLVLVKEDALAQARECAQGGEQSHESELEEILAVRDQLGVAFDGGACELAGPSSLLCEIVESGLISGVGRLSDAAPPQPGVEHEFVEELARLTGLAALLAEVRQRVQAEAITGSVEIDRIER